MVGKVVLLTGVPGVGKTTLVQFAHERVEPLHVITFGEMIFEVRKREEPELTYQHIRAAPTKHAAADIIARATDLLIERTRELRRVSNVVIDSHAVARDDYGFRITPDSHAVLQHLALDAVIVLHAEPETVLSRIHAAADGRRAVTSRQLAVHEALQDAVAVAYAVASGCPAYVLEVDSEMDQTFVSLLRVLEAVGMELSMSNQR
jgi:adenylate kinase